MPLIFSIYKLKLGGIIPTTNLFSKFLEKNVEHSVETLNYPVLEVPYYNFRSFSFPFSDALESASNFSISKAIPFWFYKYQAKNNDRVDNIQDGEFSALRKPVSFLVYNYPSSGFFLKIKNEDGTFKSQALWSEAHQFFTEYNTGVDFLFDNSYFTGVEGRRSYSTPFFSEIGYGSTPVYDESRTGESFLSALRQEASFYYYKNNAEHYQETQKEFFAGNIKFDVKAAANPTLGLNYDSESITTFKGIPLIIESFNYRQADSFFIEFGYGDEPVKFVIEEGYHTGKRGYVFFFHYKNDGVEPFSDSFPKVTESVQAKSHQTIPYYGYSYEGSYNTKLDYYDISSFGYSRAQSFYYYKNDGVEPFSDSFPKVTESLQSNSHPTIPYCIHYYEGSYDKKLEYYDISSFRYSWAQSFHYYKNEGSYDIKQEYFDISSFSYSLAQSFHYYKNPSYQFCFFESSQEGVYSKLRKIDKFLHYTYSSAGYNSYLIADNVVGRVAFYDIFYEGKYQGYNIKAHLTCEGYTSSFNINDPHTVLVKASNNIPDFLIDVADGMSQTYFFTPYIYNQYYGKNISVKIFGNEYALASNSLPSAINVAFNLNQGCNIKVNAAEDQTPIFNEDGLTKSKARSLGLSAYHQKIGQHVQIIPKASISQNTFDFPALPQPYYVSRFIGGYDLTMYASTEQSVEYGNFSFLKEAFRTLQGTEHPKSFNDTSQDFEIDYSHGIRVVLEWHDFNSLVSTAANFNINFSNALHELPIQSSGVAPMHIISIVSLSKNFDFSFNNALQELPIQISGIAPMHLTIEEHEGINFENLAFQLYGQELEFLDRINWSYLYTLYLGKGFYQEPFISTHSPAAFSQIAEIIDPYTYTRNGFNFSPVYDKYGYGYGSRKSLATHGIYLNRKYQSSKIPRFYVKSASFRKLSNIRYVQVQNYAFNQRLGGQRVARGETTFLI